jgi:hypothetical protein
VSVVASDVDGAEEQPDMTAQWGGNVRVMLVTGGSEFEAATELDISEFLEYDPTPITFTDAEGEAPELDAAIYLENGDAMRETPEEAIARINAELEAWEDMSTAARWVPELEDEDDDEQSTVLDWMERVAGDLMLTPVQRRLLETMYAMESGTFVVHHLAGLPSTDTVYHRSTDG